MDNLEVCLDHNCMKPCDKCEVILLRSRLNACEKALNRFAGEMGRDPWPTCMTLQSGEFGPPRTNGWEGWFLEYKRDVQNLARSTLAEIRGSCGP